MVDSVGEGIKKRENWKKSLKNDEGKINEGKLDKIIENEL